MYQTVGARAGRKVRAGGEGWRGVPIFRRPFGSSVAVPRHATLAKELGHRLAEQGHNEPARVCSKRCRIGHCI